VGGEKGRQEELAERRPVAGYRYRYVDLTDRQRIEQEVGLECRKARRGRSWAGWWSKDPRVPLMNPTLWACQPIQNSYVDDRVAEK
jgi:hypothetical protein